ncbi:MAG: putative glycoside hydrolase [Patescibacteria group bacterium]
MRYFVGFLFFLTFLAGVFFILFKNNTSEISANDLPSVPEARVLPIATSSFIIIKNSDEDIENQKPLINPPSEIKAVYITSWSAGSEKKTDYLIRLIKDTELNAVVIDIKDFSGYVTYDIKNSDVEKYGAKQIRTPKINYLIKRFHDEGIYVIARITVFQDPILAKARPDLAIHSKASGGLWLDHKKLAWMDPAAKEVWDYNVAIGEDALNRGFDELNFDYIRFASDGFIGDMGFPVWDEAVPKQEVIKNFFKYLREQFLGAKISADIFGQATINNNDLGIGQIIEDAYAYFDYVCPMIYPSHYAKMFLGYKNPANYPYEVVRYSMDNALQKIGNWKLEIENSLATNKSPKLRPWLQDFDLGADYDTEKVKKQIQAVYDSASSTPELISGWMLWNPSNVYTREALK